MIERPAADTTPEGTDGAIAETKEHYFKHFVSMENLCTFVADSPFYDEELDNLINLWRRVEELYDAHVEQSRNPNFDFPEIAAHKQWELSGLFGYSKNKKLSELDVDSLAASIKSGKICHVTTDADTIDLLSRYLESIRMSQPVQRIHAKELPRSLTASQTIMHSQSLTEKGKLDRQEVRQLQIDLWPRLESHYMAYQDDRKIPVKNLFEHERALRWQASGLVPVDPTLSSLGAITLDSLVESVSSGAIRMITRDYESQVTALVRFLKPYTGKDIEPGNYDDTSLQQQIDELKHHHDVMSQMVEESYERDYEGKCISGPYRSLFTRVNTEYMERLKELDERLTGDAFHAEDYRSRETKDLIRTTLVAEKLGHLAKQRLDALGNISDLTRDRDHEQTIPLRLFDIPQPTGQNNYQACATAAFRMIYQGITGHFIGEEEIRGYLRNTYGTEFISDMDYIKLMETETFKNEYDRTVSGVLFGGMSLAALRKYVEGRRAQQPEANVFVTAALRTHAVMSPSRAQHRVVLLGAEQDTVQLIDPLAPHQPNMPKRAFLRRWASAQNSGYAVIAE